MSERFGIERKGTAEERDAHGAAQRAGLVTVQMTGHQACATVYFQRTLTQIV